MAKTNSKLISALTLGDVANMAPERFRLVILIQIGKFLEEKVITIASSRAGITRLVDQLSPLTSGLIGQART